MDPEALLEGLDDAQRSAVTSTAMPLVVLAPAGSGKTRVLTRRIAYRVATGEADPRHVLALTFTRKAAGELEDRLNRLGLRSDATTGTFHAVAWGALRQRWTDQRRAPLALLDRKGRLLADLAPTVAGKDKRTVVSDLSTEIEWAKARMVTPDAYVAATANAVRKPVLKTETVAEVYAAYETRKRRGGLVDFEDLLALVARALEEDATFAAAQRWRFRHLFVDELQDVNPLQFRLLEAWRGDRYDVMAVGDAQQAIYGWNGADAGFLLDIHRWWPPAEVIELGRSYRSTPEILTAGAAVLRGARQPARTIEATRAAGPPVHLQGHTDDRTEALAIARGVRLRRAPGRRWSEQAVLVRTHAQTHLITEALREAGIPHRVRGGATDDGEEEAPTAHHLDTRDALDVATFHAAKGLEWVTVHIAGAEDGYVPIVHARSAAARAEEARLLYVAMTRAQRELRITWADHRTFAGKVVDRRRSPLLDPVVQWAAAHPVPPEHGPITPPVDDWADEVARQRARLDATRASVAPELESLRHWRDVAARAARIEPEAVLPDHVLSRVVAAHPRDLDELGAVRGVGPILAKRFGDAMLGALAPPADAGGDR